MHIFTVFKMHYLMLENVFKKLENGPQKTLDNFPKIVQKIVFFSNKEMQKKYDI